jgi:hypothetical protein
VKCAWSKCCREFEPGRGGRNHTSRLSRQRFCSRKCQRRAYYAADPARYKRYGANKPPEDPRHSRDRTLRYKYGIGCDEYDRRLIEQDGRCAICRGIKTYCSVGDFFSVDHDHSTGDVRGLLCGHCNRGLGMMSDDPVRLRAAADYLERARIRRAG